MKIALILPVHNHLEYTRETIRETMAHFNKIKDHPFEMVVIDDGSIDGTSDWIREHYSEIAVLHGDGNLWWSGAVNLGVRYAFEKLQSDYVLLWNNDITVEENYFQSLITIIRQHPKSTIIGSKILIKENSSLIWSMGGFFNATTGKIGMYGYYQNDTEEFNHPREADWLTGMGTVISREVVEDTGYWNNTSFPQYHGDSDFTYRAKKRGFKIIVEPCLTIYNSVQHSGIEHNGSLKQLIQLISDTRSKSNFKRNLKFYRLHSESYRAYIPFAFSYFRIFAGFMKWKVLSVAGLKKKNWVDMKQAYLYPVSSRMNEVSNPYLNDFTTSLSNEIVFVNKDAPSAAGIMDIFKYITRIDFVFLNWIEDLPDKKGGYIQTFAFLILLRLFKTKGIRIFYTMHNRESHHGQNKKLKRLLRNQILHHADYILCHASEGLNILSRYHITQKYIYLPHPFRHIPAEIPPKNKKYDLIIWGSIKPYKGIDGFLKFLEERNLLKTYRILIVGKILPEQYTEEFTRFQSEYITIENRFVGDDPLNDLIRESAIVLFTYKEKSVLSSGALAHSLSLGAHVIGPNVGAFGDLNSEGLIDVFDDYSQLIEIINQNLNQPTQYASEINDFIARNTWAEFGKKISTWITGTN